MALIRSVRSKSWSLEEPTQRIRHIISSYQRRILLEIPELEALAQWLYLDDSDILVKDMRKIKCHRAAGVHLIGFDLMFALCHAEHLVFMDQALLPYKVQEKIASLRWTTESGSSTSKSQVLPDCIGFKVGMDGYRDAVEYIYNDLQRATRHECPAVRSPATKIISCVIEKSPNNRRVCCRSLGYFMRAQ